LTEIGLQVLEKIFKNFQCIFTLSLLFPFGIRGCPSYLLYLRMICANFGYNWPSGSGEEVENVRV
jgi:hypothetical protein